MSRIDPVYRFLIQPPAAGGRTAAGDRRTGFQDRRASADAVVIDLNPEDFEAAPHAAPSRALRAPGAPVPALRLAEATREILTYEVIARLGSQEGFGEKGRIVNRYL